MTKGGGGLTNAEREDLYTAMMEMYKANEDEANAYIQSYTDLANRYGINPADIMPRQYYQSSQIQSTTNNDPLGIRG
jgi:DNA-binding SARP family transcriptional activator